MKQQLHTMLQMQDAMNSKVHQNWRQQGFEWYRAIWIECGELMDHYGWKWWKKQDPDYDQVMLEVVDIWHFGLSDLLQRDSDLEQIVSSIYSQLMEDIPTGGDFRSKVEVFALSTLQHKGFDVRTFKALLLAMDMSFSELYRRYVGKNVLNFFRQDNGYKDGSYRKLWQGREDNEHLVELLSDIDIARSDFADAVYAALQTRYENSASEGREQID